MRGAPSGRLDLLSAVLERRRETRIVERRHPVVTQGVEPDLVAVGREGGERGAPDPRVGRRRPGSLAEHGRQRGAGVGRQLLDRLGEARGSAVGPVERRGDDLLREPVQVARREKATIERPLEVLPPERARLVERGTGDEEARHRARAPEDRRGLREVAREVVVERQRDRDAPAPAAGRRRALQRRRRDDRVAPREVADLLLERGAADRRHDLRAPVASSPPPRRGGRGQRRPCGSTRGRATEGRGRGPGVRAPVSGLGVIPASARGPRRSGRAAAPPASRGLRGAGARTGRMRARAPEGRS